jgi:hypothetical protein
MSGDEEESITLPDGVWSKAATDYGLRISLLHVFELELPTD